MLACHRNLVLFAIPFRFASSVSELTRRRPPFASKLTAAPLKPGLLIYSVYNGYCFRA
jgi:hypothetical protein